MVPVRACLIALLAFLLNGVHSQAVTCSGPNEVASSCVTCDNLQLCPYLRQDNPCIEPCKPGCNCADGFFRNASKICVSSAECPQTFPCYSPNQAYSECAPTCFNTDKCPAQRDPTVTCVEECSRRCTCVQGFFKNTSDICVAESDCPAVCQGQNEYYYGCKPACPEDELCPALRDPDFVCTKDCSPGCTCLIGHYRNAAGVCVPVSECPCRGQNEEYRSCGPFCFNNEVCPSMVDPGFACDEECVSGCTCKEGFFRNPEGVCVEESQCPPRCENPFETYSSCKLSCEGAELCPNLPGANTNCTECAPGCTCFSTYFRNSSGACVPEAECVQPQAPKRRRRCGHHRG